MTNDDHLIALSSAHLTEIAAELFAYFVDCVLVDLATLPPCDMLLVFADGIDKDKKPVGPIRRLRLSASPDAPRLHVQHEPVERHKGPVGPFCQRAHQELVGPKSRLARIDQPKGERVLRLNFKGTPSGKPFALLLELFGRRANLAFLDSSDTILAMLSSPTGKSAERLRVGKTWEAPPLGGGAAPKESSPLDSFAGLAGEPPDRKYPVNAPLSWIVESLLGGAAEGQRWARERRDLLRRLDRRIKRAKKMIKGLDARRTAAATADRVRMDGDLLKSSLQVCKRGATEIELEDWFEGGTRKITLDPARSPKQNLERLYSRYKKLLRGLAGMEEEEARAGAKLETLTRLRERASDDELDPAVVEREAVTAGELDAAQSIAPKAGREKAKVARLPYRIFHGKSGVEIRVGRNARDNDELSIHHCRGNDLWLHTADSPGSHVVISLAGAKDANEEDLLDAACLALHFSPQREAGKANIHIARGKEVHKPRGSKAGLVMLSGGRSMRLRRDDQRIERLLKDS
jgi:predicted ribosome quality control (RQC) complex YloA/Tae2 family protein